jgi:hypothetical protein
MIYLAWADIYGLAMLSAWLALRDTHRRPAIVCLGLCLAAKPTLGAILLIIVLWSRTARRELPAGIAVAAAVILPFAVWDGFNFWQSTVGTLFSPLVYVNRIDALSVNSIVHLFGGMWMPAPTMLLLTLALSVPIVATRPRDGCDTLAMGAALTTVIVVTGRPAFLNYYFVAAAALLLALAMEQGAGRLDDIALPGFVHPVIGTVGIGRTRAESHPGSEAAHPAQ